MNPKYKYKAMKKPPATTAHIKINRQSFARKSIEGEVSAGGFNWQFNWQFSNDQLLVEPPLGRALIQDALLRFLVKADYSLETGGDYHFTVRSKF